MPLIRPSIAEFAKDKSELVLRARFGRHRFESKQTSPHMLRFKKRSRFGSFLNGISLGSMRRKASRTLLSWDTGKIMVLLFLACISSDFVFELSPTRPLPFTFRFFTTRFNVFAGAHFPTTLTWGPYHIEYRFGAYPIPPPIFDYVQECGSLCGSQNN